MFEAMMDRMMDRLTWAPFISLLHKELLRFWKVVVQTVITPIINSALYLLIFGVSLGSSISMDNGLSYIAFLIPGLVMMGAMNNSFQNSSSSIVGAKYGGDLEDLKVVPLSPSQIVWALSFGGLVRGVLVAFITFLVGSIFYWFTSGSWMSIAHPGALVFYLIVGGLAFAKLGLIIAFNSKSVDQMSAFSTFVLLPLMYLGGVFFSIKSLHPFWQTVSQFNPMLYFIDGVRFGMLGIHDIDLKTGVVVSLLALLGLHIVAIRIAKHASYGRW